MKAEKNVNEYLTPQQILDQKLDRIGRKKELGAFSAEFLVLLAALAALFIFVLGITVYRGDSMAPEMKAEELLLYYRLDREYAPGDIVVLEPDREVEYVKRIAAVAGDTVDINADGQLLVNGLVCEESYASGLTKPVDGKTEFPLEVGEKQIFVLGDNREHSVDSREFGCVDTACVTGRVIWHVGR